MTAAYKIRPEDILGKMATGWLPQETAKKFHLLDKEVISTKRPLRFEDVFPTPDGVPHHWLTFKFPLEGPEGDLLVGTVRIDITEQKQAEAALQGAKEMAETPTGQRANF